MHTDAEKLIFSFKRHGKEVFGDPIALLWEFNAILGGEQRAAEIVDMARSGALEPAIKAMMRLRDATLHTFKLGKPWDEATGKGVQQSEWLGTMNQFFEWLKKNGMEPEDSPTSPAASPAPPSPEPSATTNTAASS